MNTRQATTGGGGRPSPGDASKDGGKGGGSGEKADKGKDGKNVTKRQVTLDNVMRKVKFEDEKLEELKDKVMEEIKKSEEIMKKVAEELKRMRQEKVELGKLKVDIIEKESGLEGRLESVEKMLNSIKEKDKDRDRKIAALEERFENWAGDGDADSLWDAASCRTAGSGVSRKSAKSEVG